MKLKPTTVTPAQLARLTSTLLTSPASVGEFDTAEKHVAFVNELTQLICDHCGGEVVEEATEDNDAVTVGPNDSLPDDGGIWKHVV